jgi:putative FmdB family regulatory protein
MPTYEYQCIKCENRFELVHPHAERRQPRCPECKGRSRKLFSPVAVIYRGSGFYVTDNPGKHGKPPKPSKSSDPAVPESVAPAPAAKSTESKGGDSKK